MLNYIIFRPIRFHRLKSIDIIITIVYIIPVNMCRTPKYSGVIIKLWTLNWQVKQFCKNYLDLCHYEVWGFSFKIWKVNQETFQMDYLPHYFKHNCEIVDKLLKIFYNPQHGVSFHRKFYIYFDVGLR